MELKNLPREGSFIIFSCTSHLRRRLNHEETELWI